MDAKELLSRHGLWAADEADVQVQLLQAYDQALAADASNRLLIAKICAHLRQATGKSVADIAAWLTAECPRWGKTFPSVCRYVRAGELLLKWPVLEDILSIDKLNALNRVPAGLKPEVFASGLLPDGQPFRDLDREALTAAVNSLRDRRTTPEVVPAVKARRDISRFTETMQALATELAMLQRFPRIQEQLAQWQRQLAALLEEELNPVVRSPFTATPAAQARGQYHIR